MTQKGERDKILFLPFSLFYAMICLPYLAASAAAAKEEESK
jgi:hypothetical protein